MKVLVKLALDTDDLHERAVYEILTNTRGDAQKDLLVSSVLYYTKSPSHLAELRMAEYIERIDQLNRIFTEPTYLALSAKIEELAAVKDDLVASVISTIDDHLDGIDLSGVRAGHKSKKKSASVDVPVDVLDGMMDSFGTEGS